MRAARDGCTKRVVAEGGARGAGGPHGAVWYLERTETMRPPFRLRSLEVSDFRGIHNLKLTFPLVDDEGALTVLTGDNGAGKTTVLEAIVLGLGRKDLLDGSMAPLDHQIRLGARGFSIGLSVVPSRSDGVLTRVQSPWGFQHPARVIVQQTRSGRPTVSIPPEKAEVEYFPAVREGRGANAPGRIADLKRKLQNVYFRSHRDGAVAVDAEGSPFGRVQRFVRRFLGSDVTLDVFPMSNDPSSEHEVVLRRGPIPIDVSSLEMARALSPERKDIPEIVTLEQLSSGQLALFAYAGPLVFRDRPADVVLIDEPEQHLHLLWQRSILGALRELSPTSHFVVATHSRDVVNSALHAERISLVADNDPRASGARAGTAVRS